MLPSGFSFPLRSAAPELTRHGSGCRFAFLNALGDFPLSLKRYQNGSQSVTVDQAVANSTDIDFGSYAGMVLTAPAGWTSATVTFHKAHADGSFVPLFDHDGNAVTVTLAPSTAMECPPELFACGLVRLTSDQAGNNAIPIGVSFKG